MSCDPYSHALDAAGDRFLDAASADAGGAPQHQPRLMCGGQCGFPEAAICKAGECQLAYVE